MLSGASSALAEGELLQREDAWNVEVPRERYLRRCDLKTARLFAAACRLGALEGGGDADGLGAFGRRIGLAFQLLDDVLDVSGPAERTGKHRGTDLLDGTVTLPLILARERDPALARLDLRAVRTAAEAEAVCDAIAATGVLATAREDALEMVAAAKADLPDAAGRRSARRSSWWPTRSSTATPERGRLRSPSARWRRTRARCRSARSPPPCWPGSGA